MVKRPPGADVVKRCLAHVRGALSDLFEAGSSVDASLYQSIAALLRKDLRRLRQGDLSSQLPAHLVGDAMAWKAALPREVLERVAERRASHWRNALVEMFQRLSTDWPALVSEFGISSNARLEEISEPLGDLHNDGRFVCTLGFDNGARIVYKPRPVEAEQAFAETVSWLGRAESVPDLRRCRVLTCFDYGWTIFVENVPCTSVGEAFRYFERQGAFLALFYLLCGGDCIAENVVVERDHPVWIDTECLCLPDLVHRPHALTGPSWMKDSVLGTSFVFLTKAAGLPPRRFTALSRDCFDNPALMFERSDVLKDCYIQAVVSGFSRTYGWILDHREDWTSSEGPLSWWRDRRVRVIPKPTGLYAAIVDTLAVVPDGDRDALIGEIRHVLCDVEGPTNWPSSAVDVEMRALERGDVPFWTTTTSGKDVREAAGGLVRNLSVRSGMECVTERARQMGRGDCHNQLWLIDTFLRVSTS